MSALEKLRVLAADDNPHMLTLLCTLLRGMGLTRLETARNGRDALAMLKTFPADVAIVDYVMAPTDGLEFTRQIRTDANIATPYLPVILLTSHTDRARVCAARDAGVTEFLAKPLTAKSLAGRLQGLILKPRPFIRTEDFFGPCRRRLASDGHLGPWRRCGDPQREACA